MTCKWCIRPSIYAGIKEEKKPGEAETTMASLSNREPTVGGEIHFAHLHGAIDQRRSQKWVCEVFCGNGNPSVEQMHLELLKTFCTQESSSWSLFDPLCSVTYAIFTLNWALFKWSWTPFKLRRTFSNLNWPPLKSNWTSPKWKRGFSTWSQRLYKKE